MHSWAIVQIQATRYKAGDKTSWDELEEQVPGFGGGWEDFTEVFTPPQDGYSLQPSDDTLILKDVVGLQFSSVGDWTEWTDFFDHWRSEIGVLEIVDPCLGKIVADLEKINPEKRNVTMITLWQGWETYCMDEWDFEHEYYGTFDIKRIKELIDGN